MENIWKDGVEDIRENMPKLCTLLGRNDQYYHRLWREIGYIDFIEILGCVRARLWDNHNQRWKQLTEEEKQVLRWAIAQQEDQLKDYQWKAETNLDNVFEILGK